MSRAGLLATVGVVFFAAAVGGGHWLNSRAQQRDLMFMQELRLQRDMLAKLSQSVSDLAQRPSPPSVSCAAAGSNGPLVDTASIENAVKQAMTQQANQVKAEQEELKQPTDENLKAYAQVESIVQSALGAKRWTEADAIALRNAAGHITGQQHETLLRQLSAAINSGKLSVQTDGPPF
jgi:hypothetical protein